MPRRPLSEPPPSHVLDVTRTAEARSSDWPLAKAWRWFYVVRVGLLLGILTIVATWGISDYAGRQTRLEWAQPLDVALVLIEQGGLDPDAVRRFRARIPDLEQQLEREFQQYRHADTPPIRFFLYGPVSAPAPPSPVPTDSFLDQVVDAASRRIYAARISRLARTPIVGLDSTIYIAARPPGASDLRFVEGFSEQGGRHGFVDVQLDAQMVDYALFVAVHELFHTLGATDKYDGQGKTMLPSGLADPNQLPLFPQRQADVMAHGRPIRKGVDLAPDTLSQLGVGPATARELRWLVDGARGIN